MSRDCSRYQIGDLLGGLREDLCLGKDIQGETCVRDPRGDLCRESEGKQDV